jgi:hypothetical protein
MIHRSEYGLDVTAEEADEFNEARTAVIAAGYYSR